MRTRKTVLIADASETFSMYLSVLLNRMGFNVIPALNGVEAIKLVRVLLPDIALLSLSLPLMEGAIVLRHMKSGDQTSKIQVIMVSADHDEKSVEECTRLGCSGFLKKPVQVSKLNELLQKCVTYEGGKQRKCLRTCFEKKVMVTHSGVSQGLIAVSLSEGGMFIRKMEPFPVGSEVVITMGVREGKVLNLKGSVIYHKGVYGDMLKIGTGIGIAFHDVSPDDMRLLRKYITEILIGDLVQDEDEAAIVQEADAL
ncbi:MAG: response regulator [bacterium]